MKKRNLSPEEKRIWARVSRGIEPLSRGIHRPVAPEHMPHLEDMAADITPTVEPTERERPRWTLPKPHQPDEPRKTPAPPLNRGGEKRVRRGQIEIAASFDLHGFTQDKAPLALYPFVSTQRRQGRDACWSSPGAVAQAAVFCASDSSIGYQWPIYASTSRATPKPTANMAEQGPGTSS